MNSLEIEKKIIFKLMNLNIIEDEIKSIIDYYRKLLDIYLLSLNTYKFII